MSETMEPSWTISADKSRIRIWLNGGCIDSIERLNETEEFLRRMRPLLSPKQSPATPKEPVDGRE